MLCSHTHTLLIHSHKYSNAGNVALTSVDQFNGTVVLFYCHALYRQGNERPAASKLPSTLRLLVFSCNFKHNWKTWVTFICCHERQNISENNISMFWIMYEPENSKLSSRKRRKFTFDAVLFIILINFSCVISRRSSTWNVRGDLTKDKDRAHWKVSRNHMKFHFREQAFV